MVLRWFLVSLLLLSGCQAPQSVPSTAAPPTTDQSLVAKAAALQSGAPATKVSRTLEAPVVKIGLDKQRTSADEIVKNEVARVSATSPVSAELAVVEKSDATPPQLVANLETPGIAPDVTVSADTRVESTSATQSTNSGEGQVEVTEVVTEAERGERSSVEETTTLAAAVQEQSIGSPDLGTDDEPVTATKEADNATESEESESPLLAQPKSDRSQIGITGRMSINFDSRLSPDQPDIYIIELLAANVLKVSGKILRKPPILGAIVGYEREPLQLEYDLSFTGRRADGDAWSPVGSWKGVLVVDKQGLYRPKGLAINSSTFAGSIQGKRRGEPGVFESVREYTRSLGGKKVALKVKRSDPLRFNNLLVAGGPTDNLEAFKISGHLDYDYDTGNWLSNGLTLSSNSGSSDTISGSIKWVEDEERERNGLGQYEFNLRFNEERFKEATSQASSTDSMSDEEAFFAVNPEIPTLYGTMRYRDSYGSAGPDEEAPVIRSDVIYDLSGERLTNEQLINFLKLWLLIVGPVNDE